jgi:hypothetical protein
VTSNVKPITNLTIKEEGYKILQEHAQELQDKLLNIKLDDSET